MFLRGPWRGEGRVSVPGGWPGTAGLQMEKWGRHAGGLYRQKRAGRGSPPDPPEQEPGGTGADSGLRNYKVKR